MEASRALLTLEAFFKARFSAPLKNGQSLLKCHCLFAEQTLPSPVLTSSVRDQLATFESKLDQCAAQNDLAMVQSNIQSQSEEYSRMFGNINEQLKSLDKLAFEMELDTDMIEAVKKNTQRIDLMEITERKNNLIIKGIKQERRLERPHHLDVILRKFFKEILSLPGLKFEEVSHYKDTCDDISIFVYDSSSRLRD